MSGSNDYRTILRSSSISGLASIANIASGLLKLKVVALVLGPMGIGLFGLYQNLMQTAATVATMGLDTIGTRHVAKAAALDDSIAVSSVHRTLRYMTLFFGVLGSVLFALTATIMAEDIFGPPVNVRDLVWLALGVGITVVAVAPTAMLTGLRRISDLARIQALAGLLSAAIGVLAVLALGDAGLIAAIVSAPLAVFLLSLPLMMRLTTAPKPTSATSAPVQKWRSLLIGGIWVMVASLVTLSGPLAIRTIIQRELGGEASGYFQAAWAIGMTYLGFVLGAMATDFYPRLTASVNDPTAVTRIVNEQTEVALLLCAPIVLCLMGSAQWVITLLYASGFEPAAGILRWQLLGDILKIISWPLGFLLLASGANRTFLICELVGMCVFVGCAVYGLSWLGINATGIGFFAMYVVYLPVVWWFAGRRIGFAYSGYVSWLSLAVMAAATLVFVAAKASSELGVFAGLGFSTAFAIIAIIRLNHKTDLRAWYKRLP